jgi:hypothetical protein
MQLTLVVLAGLAAAVAVAAIVLPLLLARLTEVAVVAHRQTTALPVRLAALA